MKFRQPLRAASDSSEGERRFPLSPSSILSERRGIELNFGVEKAITIKISALKMAPLTKIISNDDKFRDQNIKNRKILGTDFT